MKSFKEYYNEQINEAKTPILEYGEYRIQVWKGDKYIFFIQKNDRTTDNSGLVTKKELDAVLDKHNVKFSKFKKQTGDNKKLGFSDKDLNSFFVPKK